MSKSLGIRGVDFVPFRPVPSVFTIPVASLVEKHIDFVPVLIPAIPELFQPYRDKYQILAG